eukprot:SAG31_NODE_31939_length_362_cov_0.775665_1_plen_29_part_01
MCVHNEVGPSAGERAAKTPLKCISHRLRR